ncbi:MAG: HNH endonuclease, partial [Halobacteriaceae archaeon]
MTEQKTGLNDWLQIREAVIERDNHRCTDCTRPEEVVESFHIDHNVPQGRGGSDRFSNLQTLCKQCHRAKHGDGYAPMLELQSTGAMDDYTFRYFRHFFDEILPAMGRSIGVRLDPKFRLDDKRDVWFVSLGNVR